MFLYAQSCSTLCDSTNCSPPGSFVHGILQARMLEWVAMLYSRGSFQPGTEPTSLTSNLHWQAGPLPLAPSGKPMCTYVIPKQHSYYDAFLSLFFPLLIEAKVQGF